MEVTYAQIRKWESAFIEESFDTPSCYQMLEGTGSVIISAPHSVIQTRNGKEKQGEFLTGVLVQLLHQATNCYGAYKTKHNEDDANFDAVNPYKDAVINEVKTHSIQTILDLHIMSDARPHHIDIGTARGRNLAGNEKIVAMIIKHFDQNGIDKVKVDEIFTAGNPNTVSSTVHRETGITAVQIEINWRLLKLDEGKLDSFWKVFNVLKGVVTELQNE